MNYFSHKIEEPIRWVSIVVVLIFFLLAGSAESKEKRNIYKGPKLSLGVGVWISTGKTSWNHDASKSTPVAGNPTSELTYEDLQSNVYEAEAELKLPQRFFIRTQFGVGKIEDGTLINDDFVSPAGATFFGATQSGEHRISRTLSEIDDDYLWYVNIDVGHKFWVSRNKRSFLKGFLGYQHWQEKAGARGLKQIECTSFQATNPNRFCFPPGTETNGGQKVITNKVRWDSFRIGLEGGFWFSKRLRLETQAAFIPYSKMLNQDTHHLRTTGSAALKQDPSFEMDGVGIGYNLEASLNFRITRKLTFSAGYKYWRIDVSGGDWKSFPATGATLNANLNDLYSYRHGATVKIEYLFSIPKNWKK